MSDDWHTLIQSYIAGLASDGETEALQTALKADPQLRALYLEYIKLDLDLEAAAGAWRREERAIDLPPPERRGARFSWPWITAAAACVAVALLLSANYRSHRAEQRPLASQAFVAARDAILQMPPPSTASLPSWMSPTSSLLAPPHLPQ